MDELKDGVLPESEMKLRTHLTSLLKDRLSRRELLKAGGVSGLSLAALWALACQQAAPAPTPTKAPVAVAPTPTTAPVAVAPTPTKPPAATPTAEKIGARLIGKWEGPEIITDPTKFPKTFKEAPELAELVKAGKLPAVAERVSQDPLVVKPVHEIGKYGGLWRRAFLGPADFWNGLHANSGPDHPLFWAYDGYKVVPNICRGWEVSADGRVTTFFLRRGMKWSDGQPFTADDWVFQFQDMYLNKELIPVGTIFLTWQGAGKEGVAEKVDTYTVRYKFPDPFPMLYELMAGANPLGGGHSLRGREGMGVYAPAHYLKQFHPKYVAKADLDKKVADLKFDNWRSLILNKNSWALNPALPVLTAWKTTVPNNTPQWVLERNPYSIWVDTEGNQLPYIPKVVMVLAESGEILNLRAIAGEVDIQNFNLSLTKLPVFLENQKKGDYIVSLSPGDYSGFIIKFNMNYGLKDPEIGKWFENADFRRALAIAIDRDQINEMFFMGTGVPSAAVTPPHVPYNPGPEYNKMWATYEPKKAAEMLDKIGLDKKDAEGFRLRTDGKGRLRLTITVASPTHASYEQWTEPVVEFWKKIGVDAKLDAVERSLSITRGGANETMLSSWNNDGTEHLWSFPFHATWLSIATLAPGGPEYGKWYNSAGKEGVAPKGKLKELMDLWLSGLGATYEERLKIGKAFWKMHAEEVFIIGIIGAGPDSGVRIHKTKLGNVAARMYVGPEGKGESIVRPVTYYWKS